MATVVAESGVAAAEPRTFRPVNPGGIVWVAVAGVLVLLVVYPMVWLVLKSLQPAAGEGLTLQNYVVAFSGHRTGREGDVT